MKAVVIEDRDANAPAYRELTALVYQALRERGVEAETIAVGRGDLAYCTGCFGCWVKKPGECVLSDRMGEINRACMNSDAILYVTPIVFGQYSANIKAALDRWIPNILPYFIVRSDGSTMHPARYARNPRQIAVGCADGACAQDVALFEDINKKHRRGADVVVYTGDGAQTLAALKSVPLERMGDKL